VASVAWSRLASAVQASCADERRGAVMMSGGWDSRTLLAAVRVSCLANTIGYTHGDLDSRELDLAERVTARAGVAWHGEPIDARVFEPAALHSQFQRTESVMFPHWAHSGRVLAQSGNSFVASGVYGEVLGGHYGRAMLLGG